MAFSRRAVAMFAAAAFAIAGAMMRNASRAKYHDDYTPAGAHARVTGWNHHHAGWAPSLEEGQLTSFLASPRRC